MVTFKIESEFGGLTEVGGDLTNVATLEKTSHQQKSGMKVASWAKFLVQPCKVFV